MLRMLVSTGGLPCGDVFQQKAEQAAQAFLAIGRGFEVDRNLAEPGGVAVTSSPSSPAPIVLQFVVLVALNWICPQCSGIAGR